MWTTKLILVLVMLCVLIRTFLADAGESQDLSSSTTRSQSGGQKAMTLAHDNKPFRLNLNASLEKRCDSDNLQEWCQQNCWNPWPYAASDAGNGGRYPEYNGYNVNNPSGGTSGYGTRYSALDGWSDDCWKYCSVPCQPHCNAASSLFNFAELRHSAGGCSIAILIQMLLVVALGENFL
ncbi:hypothetical protein EDD21DRAFT_401392 [Dissophora ornata]|nr:hypothetical protein EDD21DRAFT_401392 [Dissophora ornata]